MNEFLSDGLLTRDVSVSSGVAQRLLAPLAPLGRGAGGEGRALTRLWLASPLRGEGQSQTRSSLHLPLTPDPSPRSTGARGETRGSAAFQNAAPSPQPLRIKVAHYLRVLLLALCLSLTGGQSAVAQLAVRVERVDGVAVTGQWVAGSMQQVVVEDSQKKRTTLPTDSIISLRVGDVGTRSFPVAAGNPWLLLASGERLRAALSVIDDTFLTASLNQFPNLKPFQVPLESCRGATLSLPTDPTRQGLELRRLMTRAGDSDLLTLRNADRIEGELLGLSDAKFQMQTTLGKVASDMPVVQSVAFNPKLVSLPKKAPRQCLLLLVDGSILQLAELTVSGEFLIAKSVSGFAIELPSALVAEMRFSGGRVENLSEREPSAVSSSGFLAVKRVPLRDSNVLGGPLAMRGVPLACGWSMLSGTTAEWELGGGVVAFSAIVGVDDAAAGSGSVEFEVLGDGRSLWRSKVLTGRDDPLSTPLVEVKGIKTLALRVHSADFGTVGDFANWGHAFLVRAER